MKIGIIVHSQTGNTYSVAERLKEKLSSVGHSVNIEKIIAVDDRQVQVDKVQLSNIPDEKRYDVLIFGSPVRGFSLSPVMKAYITQLSALKDKKVACFMTEAFPFPAMGGNSAMGQMKKLCESKGIPITRTGIVNWSNGKREKMIENIVEEFTKALT